MILPGFEPRDIDLIQRRREDHNRFGIALQLALLRHPGATLAQVLDRVPRLPVDLLAFIAEQISVTVSVSYLLPTASAAPIASALALPTTADEWLDQRGRDLDWRLKRFSHRLKGNHLEGVSSLRSA